jgi:Mn2+/Fe2+ NRAMP family transporter
VLLPVILIFMLLLVNRRDLMNGWTNSRFFNGVAWTTTVVMISLSLALAALSLR